MKLVTRTTGTVLTECNLSDSRIASCTLTTQISATFLQFSKAISQCAMLKWCTTTTCLTVLWNHHLQNLTLRILLQDLNCEQCTYVHSNLTKPFTICKAHNSQPRSNARFFKSWDPSSCYCHLTCLLKRAFRYLSLKSMQCWKTKPPAQQWGAQNCQSG